MIHMHNVHATGEGADDMKMELNFEAMNQRQMRRDRNAFLRSVLVHIAAAVLATCLAIAFYSLAVKAAHNLNHMQDNTCASKGC